MARPDRRRGLLIGLGVVVAAWVVWMIVAEVAWRNPEVTVDRDAVVQPAAAPPPGGVSPGPAPTPSGDNEVARGESAVRGDGAAINGSTQAPGA